MPSFVRGVVTEITEERNGLQKIHVLLDTAKSAEKAYVLTDLVGPVALRDEVVVNTTAVELDLGTGGWHMVHWNLARDEWKQKGPGHIMKLRYTSLQHDAGSVEEHESLDVVDLAGTVVVGCLLLSQVAAVAAAYKKTNSQGKLVLVVGDQNALPLVLSDLVFELRQAELIDATITAGQAFGGDYESLTVASALQIAKQKLDADAIIVANGHGSAGAGNKFGFSAMNIAAALDDADHSGATAALALRWSDADQRERHVGLSHHSRTILERTNAALKVPVPSDSTISVPRHDVVRVEVPDIGELLDGAGVTVTTMGRGVNEDPNFFRYAAAAGVFAAEPLDTA